MSGVPSERQLRSMHEELTTLNRENQHQIEEIEELEELVGDQASQARDNERRFRALVEASAQIVWSCDDSGAIVEDCPSWRRFTGSSPAEWHDAGWIGGLHPNDQVAAREAWHAALSSRDPMTLEARVWHAETDGWRWTTINAVPVVSTEGTKLGWIGTITDIDQRKRAERQLRTMASQLTVAEQRERARVAQVLHDDLQQLLTSVQMKLGFARRSIEQGTDAADAMADLEDAETWLGDAIDMSRRLSVELSPPILDTDNITDTLRWLFDHMRAMYDLEVEASVSGEFTAPNKDMQILVYQAVRELLFNVVKHSDTLQAWVEVGARDGELVVTVRDEGDGFDTTARDPFQALGTGLVRIRHRLTLFDGQLDVRSVPNDGTEAELRLPLEMLDGERREAM